MMSTDQVEALISQIAAYSRLELIDRLLGFVADFPVDFTPEYLSGQSTDRLGHLLFALCVQARRLPLAA